MALYLPNMLDFAVAYFATQLLAAITVSINAIFKAAEVETLLSDAGVAVVLTLAAYNDALEHCFGAVGRTASGARSSSAARA